MNKKVLCIIQARMESTRLPGKILLKVKGIPLLEYLARRIKQAKRIDKVVIATTKNKEDDKIEVLCKNIGIDCFRGSENDVLDRYYQCSLQYSDYDYIVRITGDCPLVDPVLIDEVINLFEKNNYDYAVNLTEDNFPDGLAVEIFKKEALYDAAKNASLQSAREHVTLYIVNNKKYKKGYLKAPEDYSKYRITVDEKQDFEVVKFLIENSKITDSYLKYIELLNNNKQIMAKNMYIKSNEGLEKSLKEDKIL